MTDARSYTISVQFGVFAGEECYEARVAEFPDVREYADTFSEAYDLALDTVEIICEHAHARGKELPQPLSADRSYSGRVTLRLPQSMHRDLVACADREGVSFNQHVVNMLFYAQGKADSVAEVKRNHTEITAVFNDHALIVRSYKQTETRKPLAERRDPFRRVPNVISGNQTGRYRGVQ
ncbi:toxin-antitoxin system HicB family antitoxin [Luteibacter sp. PPL552]